MASPPDRLDTLIPWEAPEGVRLHLRAAGLPARFLAWLVDFFIRVLFLALMLGALEPLGGLGAGTAALVVFAVEWFYPVAFELALGAATPGKRMLGLQVVMMNGLPVTPAASLLRNLLRAVDFLPLFYLLGGVCILVRADFRRPGDLVAGTLVVYREERLRPQAPTQGPAWAPQTPLNWAQQVAVLALAERAPRITPARFEELAGKLVAWLPLDAAATAGGSAPASATPGERLLALARWLAGHRTA